MRSLILALAALAFASTASAATGGPPYKLDAKGKCHDSTGKFTKQSNCTAPPPQKHCRDPKTGKYVKCGKPGSAPA